MLLAEIWADLLGVDRVGLDDNFYDLGGDSIMAIKIASRAGVKGRVLSPEQIFRHQTIAELAPFLQARRNAPAAQEAKPFDLLDMDDDSLKAIAAAMGGADSAS